MGIHASVCRQSEFGDCSNDGISNRFTNLLVANASGPFEPKPDEGNVVILESHHPGCLRLVQAVRDNRGNWIANPCGMPMFGGNFAHCSDSRFTELCEQILGHRFYGAVAIHDRYESKELSRLLSM